MMSQIKYVCSLLFIQELPIMTQLTLWEFYSDSQLAIDSMAFLAARKLCDGKSPPVPFLHR